MKNVLLTNTFSVVKEYVEHVLRGSKFVELFNL